MAPDISEEKTNATSNNHDNTCTPQQRRPRHEGGVRKGYKVCRLLFLVFAGMDNNRPAADGSRRGCAVICTDVIVIDHGIQVVLIPNLDTEHINVRAGSKIGVDSAEHKTIVAHAIDSACALEDALGTCDHEPFVIG